MEPVLPDGYRARPLRLDDLDVLVDLFERCDRAFVGPGWHRADEIRTMWSDPALDIERDVRVVEDASGAPVAYAQVSTCAPHVASRLWGRVDPDHRGRGLGTALFTWGEALARSRIGLAPPGACVRLGAWSFTGHAAAEALYADRGLEAVREQRHMRLELEAPPSPAWPDGIACRPLDVEAMRPVHDAWREAFADHWNVAPAPPEESWRRFRHWTVDNPEFEPACCFVAWDGDAIAGLVLARTEADDDPGMGWVDDLAVRRAWRRRGIATALLHHVFAVLRERGCARVGLGVDASSPTGAHDLYERVGMTCYRRFTSWEKILRDGDELAVRD